MYCRNAGYLRSLRVGAVRIDLDGNAAGVVTAEEAAWAAEELGTRMLRTANRRRSPQKQPAQETTVVPRRLGLADLKRLALSRRK
jgi:ProP effector